VPNSASLRLLGGRRILFWAGRRLLLLAFHLLGWGQDCMQRIAFHSGTEFDDGAVTDFFEQAFQHLSSQIGMRHFASAEEDSGFYLVSLLEEAQHVILLERVVVLVDVDAELYFLDGDDFLVLLGRALLLFLLVQELAVVLDAADWRGCAGGDFHQIKASFAGNFERFKRLHDAELGSVFADYTDFAGANTLIGADKTLVDNFPPKNRAVWKTARVSLEV
jgi:hypothetical protein